MEITMLEYEHVKFKDFDDDIIDFYSSFSKLLHLSTNARASGESSQMPPFRCGGFDYKINTRCLRNMILTNQFNVFEPDRPRRFAGKFVFFFLECTKRL